ncbi:MAG TPA: hypothetical protein VEW05_00490 [Candidatus Polarisedimenticolia bacterium]|nr:hypothetical protein [Candidatus Polarisedimenticolia bacterium]
MRQFFPARTNGSVVLQSIEKNFDLAQRESHLAGKADEDHAVECVRGVPALAARTVGRAKSQGRKIMTVQRERNGRRRKQRVAVAGLVALLSNGALVQASPQETKTTEKEKQVLMTQNKFYCNIKALNPAEREHHKQLTDKPIAARRQIVETEKGYEFQYSPSNVSIAELADWVAAEGKCCPFFDFHIDLEREGKVLCLRLTGEEGIKPFIRSEFQVPAK